MSAGWLFMLVAILKINALHATTCTLQSKISGTGSTAVCPGDRVTFTCNATTNLTTQERWSGSSWGSSGSSAIFSISDPPSTVILRGTGNNFNISFVSNSPFLATKVEVASATPDLNGTTVTCHETSNGANFVEVGTGCIIFAAPPSDPAATPVSCTLDSVTLQWNGSLSDGGSNLTGYALTSNPPASNCNGSCAVDPATRLYTFSGLQPGVPYTLGVRGANCGGAQRGAQSVANITIPSQQAPLACPVFDAFTAQLTKISTTWYPLRINNSLHCGPAGTYNISYEGSDKTEVYPVSSASCNSNCSHFYSIGNRNSSQYKVSVTGYGVLNTSKNIGSINDILKVELVKWSQSVTVNCTFLSGLVGTSGCVVSFGTSPDQLLYTINSSQSGGSGQSVTVPLTINGAPLDMGTPFFYEASLLSASNPSQCVTVRGSCCAPRALGNASTVECVCSNGSFGLQIPNGCVCFTGVTPGSQASVECNSLARQVGTTVPLCQLNGLWSAELPYCSLVTTIDPSDAAEDSSTAVIVGAVVGSVVGFVILATLVVLAVVLTLFVLHQYQKKEAPRPGGVRIVEENKSEVSTYATDGYTLTEIQTQSTPPPKSVYSSDKNDSEWAAIMSVVQDAEKGTNSTP